MEEIGLVAIFDVSQFNQGLSQYISGVGNASKATDNATSSGFSFARALETAVGNSIAYVATQLIPQLVSGFVDIAKNAVSTAIDFESAWAGVTKTTDGLADEFGNLTLSGYELQMGFRDLAKEIPISVNALMEIGEIGGQLGIQKENLLDFTEAVAALGETTNLSTEAAAMGLAQMANVMGTSQEEISNMASAIVYLGNNSATTERDILNFSQRIAGVGQIAGLTEGDIFGISAAFSSIGVSAEAGGTAVQKVILAMNTSVATGDEKLQTFARTAGMTAEEFETAWREDASGAFAQFVIGLGEEGDNAIGVLEELELKDQRLIQAFLSLSQNGELLTDSISGANQAFIENTALTDEANQRYRTTDSQIQILKNNVNDLAVEFGSALLPALNDFISALVPLIKEHGPKLTQIFSQIGEIASFVMGIFAQFANGDIESGFASLGISLESVEKVFNDVKDAANTFAQFFLKELLPSIQKFVKSVTPAFEEIRSNGIKIFNAFKANLDTIWAGVKDIFKGVTSFFGGWIQVIAGLWTGDFALVWEGVKNIFSGVWDFIIGILQVALATIASLVGEDLADIVTTIEQALFIAQYVFTKVWNEITEFVTTTFENIKATAIETWATMSTNISAALTAIGNFISAAFDAIVTKFTTAFDTMSSIVSSIFKAIQTTINKAWDFIKSVFIVALGALAALISGDMESFNKIITEVWNRIQAFFNETLTNILAFAVTTFYNLLDRAREIFESIKATIQEKVEALRQAIIDTAVAIVRGLIEKFEQIKTDLPKKIEETKNLVVEKFEQFKKDVVAKVTEAVKAMTDGFLEAKDGIGDAIEDAIEAARDFLEKVDLSDIGKNMIDGLIKGLKDNTEAFVKTLKDIIKNAIKAALDLLGIDSPSKVFAEIGLNTMLGMEKGVLAGGALPEDAVSNVVSNMTNNAGNTTINNFSSTTNNSFSFGGGTGDSSQRSMYYNVLTAMEAVGR